MNFNIFRMFTISSVHCASATRVHQIIFFIYDKKRHAEEDI